LFNVTYANATYGIMADKYVICKQVSSFGHRLSIRSYRVNI